MEKVVHADNLIDIEEGDPTFDTAVSAFQIVRTLPPSDIFHNIINECTFKGKVKELPKKYEENCIYELLDGKGMEGMEHKYEGNAWTKPQTQTRTNKSFILRKSFCGGTFQCMNERCTYRIRNKSPNRLHWNGQLLKAPNEGCLALGSYGNLECFFCKHVPMCIKTCPVSAYYFMPKDPSHSRLFLHYGKHTHTITTEHLCETLKPW